MDRGERIRVVVEMAADGEPIEGTVETDGAVPRAFSGWMELVASLDEARERSSGEMSRSASLLTDAAAEEHR